MLDAFLSKGFFPQELPPPFQTATLAQAITAQQAPLAYPFIHQQGSPYISRPARFNLARAGTLRRILSIPNPISYTQLATVIATDWQLLINHTSRSSLSISAPRLNVGHSRAIQRLRNFSERPEIRAQHRVGQRYVLETDINAFYPSIYTHSIPWALHTKQQAKLHRQYDQSLGNKIDTLVRNGQDGQTKGVPIGPDISLVVAEAILSVIDQALIHAFPTLKGFRFVDDYELCFGSYAEAETVLAFLQEELTKFELQLNPYKTKIKDLPLPLDSLWKAELQRFEFRSQHTLKADLIQYFDQAFDLWKRYPDEAVLKYAVTRTRSIQIPETHWPLYQSLLLQCALAEPGILQTITDQFKWYVVDGHQLGQDQICETFAKIIALHAPQGHGSEVAWSLWGLMILGFAIDDTTANIVAKMDDPIVALLALDAQSQGLINTQVTFNLWAQAMTKDDLCGPNWLLAYQAHEHGWLSSANGVDYIQADTGFSFLRSNNVSFYDQDSSTTYMPPDPPFVVPVDWGVFETY